jgi:hypothetical protein
MHLAHSDERGLLLGYGRLPESRIPPAHDALASVLVDAGVAGSQHPTGSPTSQI